MIDKNVDVVVIGGGPGGYAAAFRAADLGLRVILVDSRGALGGVCLHEGCIPSKALLHMTQIIHEIKGYHALGIMDRQVDIDSKKLRAWIEQDVIASLSKGLDYLASKRKVEVIQATAYMKNTSTTARHTIMLTPPDELPYEISAQHVVIATGSSAVRLPFLPEDERIWDAAQALELKHTTGRMLIIGAGTIGCEMACVYAALGMDVTVCDISPRLLLHFDDDIAKMAQKSFEKQGITFMYNTTCNEVECQEDAMTVHLTTDNDTTMHSFDYILCAAGRTPRSRHIGLEDIGVAYDTRHAIIVNKQFQTNIPTIYAIGDVAGGHLAHEATVHGRVCAEVIAGKKRQYDVLAMPSVVYTYPEIASVGLTEQQLQKSGRVYHKKLSPWGGNGRAVASLYNEGATVLFADDAGVLVGACIFGVGAGDMIAECALALEMGCSIEDIGLTVHAHPTLSETISTTAHGIEGTSTES